jgi:predicted CDP-diglyceride synthetase/phosphatidate cytidylyltransferase
MIDPDKDPTTYALITYAWVIGLSAIGGLVSLVRRIREGKSQPHSVVEFIGEIMTSAFVGVITFYLCEAASVPGLMTAVMVAISGHMGTRALYMVENKVLKRIIGKMP